MSTVKILIVEDIELHGQILRKKIENLPFDKLEVQGIASNTSKAFDYIQESPPDIAIIDIELGENKRGGIEVAEYIKQESLLTIIIFVTGLPLENGYEQTRHLESPHFMDKPITEKALHRALDGALRDLEYLSQKPGIPFVNYPVSYSTYENDTVWLKPSQQESTEIQVWLKDILYVSSYQHYLSIFLKNKKNIKIKDKLLSFFERRLYSPPFHRTHQSYVVNQHYISGIVGNQFSIKDTEVLIPISNKYRDVIAEIKKSKHT